MNEVFIPEAGKLYDLEEDFKLLFKRKPDPLTRSTECWFCDYSTIDALKKLNYEKEKLLLKTVEGDEYIILPKGAKVLFRNYGSGYPIKIQLIHPGYKNFSSYKTKSKVDIYVYRESTLTGMKLKGAVA